MYWGLKDTFLGLLLIVVTTAFHTMGVVLIAFAGSGIKDRVANWKLGLHRGVLFVMLVIASVGLMLALLHGIEYAIWAAAYYGVGALDSPAQAMLYSIDAMTTRGASGLFLEHDWRMLGALEAADGMILFGISTAFLFTVMQILWPLLTNWQIAGAKKPRRP
ncbi:hypothetical protein M2323_000510 [Rhodoblastus acidophilus]|uniref:hypothetical protein n=1 Tax=Rhodoblastus acidophilus TaxID=1074 RepID=UPI0022249A4F|nr:hypothetical protein [Rhodoblastus acidophilus]MCW2282745.1 hypothetical protein [Rhodoblastus acidophilus]MCW2331606.1 hypothetical protein [Rhodoblastus acidophilus]